MDQRRRTGHDPDGDGARGDPKGRTQPHPDGAQEAGAGAPERGLPPPLGDARDRAPSSSPDDDPMRAVEILSHELRSPITTIHLGTKVLRDGGRGISPSVRLEVVEAVEEEAERLYRLVEDLLAVARHEGGNAPLPASPLLLQHWLPGVIAAEVQAAPSLRVRASIPPDLEPVLADDGALVQVVRNLLSNAVRYAPDGMPVEIVAWPAEDGLVRFEVLDRGPGIDPGEADRLFEPFYRSAAAHARGSGAGLGLAAARRLVRAMDGSIDAWPRAGGGARFVVRLPAAEPELVDPASIGSGLA